MQESLLRPWTHDELVKMFPDYAERQGRHSFRQCPLCGAADWCYSSGLAPNAPVETVLEIDPTEHRLCHLCEMMQFNFPQVFCWITRVVHGRDMLRLTPEPVNPETMKTTEGEAMNGDNKKKPGPLVEDTTVAGGLDESGAPKIVPKDSEGKTATVTTTDPREQADRPKK